MSIQRGLLGLIITIMLVLGPAGTVFSQESEGVEGDRTTLRPARSEESLISRFVPDQPLRLDANSREIRIPFSIAPNARPEGIELLLSARPDGERASGRIEAFVNRSRAVELQPRSEPFEARFSLFSDDLRAGENILVLRLVGEPQDGWSIDTAASRLRVAAAPAVGYAALDEIESALSADFAAPRRVHIEASAAGDDELAVSALIAQGLALRMGEAPILVRDASVAELTISAELRPGAAAPAIDLTGPSELRLSAGGAGSLIAAARLFAARSMEAHAVRFDMTSALSARRLDRPREAARRQGALEALAEGGAPFGADQYRSLKFDNTTADNDVGAFGVSESDLRTLSSYLGVN